MSDNDKTVSISNVPVDIAEEVQRYALRLAEERKLISARERLAELLTKDRPAKQKWIHAEVAYAELEVPFITFLDAVNEDGWALAAMGPNTFVLRNCIGGRQAFYAAGNY